MAILSGRIITLSAAAVAMASAAQAQPGPQADDGWSVGVGAGLIYAPTWEGDDDYQLNAVPNIQVSYGDRFTAGIQTGVRYNIVNNDGLRAGPIVRLSFGRDEEDGGSPFNISGDNNDDLEGLGDIDVAPEIGGFVELDRGLIGLRAEVRQAAGGHEGLIAEFGASVSQRVDTGGPPLFLSFGPTLKVVDDTYADAFFGIDGQQSVRSGLATYGAEGGLYSYGIGARAMMPVGPGVSAMAFLGYDQLAEDVADSPLVVERGDENQFSAGLLLTYRPGAGPRR